MEYEKYKVVKEIVSNNGSIPVGSEIFLVNGIVSLNGGMLPPNYQISFKKMIENEKKYGYNYLLPVKPIYNKC